MPRKQFSNAGKTGSAAASGRFFMSRSSKPGENPAAAVRF
jgi:hypothetical protein